MNIDVGIAILRWNFVYGLDLILKGREGECTVITWAMVHH